MRIRILLSDSYNRFFVRYFGVSIGDRTLILASDGTIYTRQGADRNESIKTVRDILITLASENALRSKSGILGFI
jgi:hypothetical protein